MITTILLIIVVILILFYLMKNVENFTTNSSNNSFDNHIILITGSSKGLGLSLAKYFSTKNCELIITGSNKESLKNAMETLQNHSKLKAKINGIILDLETYESIDDFYNKIKSNYKRIDIFVNCAYKKTSKSNLTNTNAKEFMKAINVNINGTFYLTQKIIKIMKSNGSGKIFFISSPSSKAGDTLF
jgi:short-subunit dehydrogenase